MDLPFFFVVVFALGLVSVMMAARMRSAGVSKRRVLWLIIELWAIFLLWIGVLWATAVRLVPEGGLGSSRDLAEFKMRFVHLSNRDKLLTIASLVLGLAIFVHFLWAQRLAMQQQMDEGE